MIRPLIFICILLFTVAALLAMSTKSAEAIHQEEVLTIFLTGHELGQLQPCDCSGGQLGGFDRRSAILKTVPKAKRLIVNTGSFVETDSEQDIIKFDVIIRSLDLLGYDLVNLTERDIQMLRDTALLKNIDSIFNVISSQVVADANIPATFTRRLTLNGKKVPITIASFDPVSVPLKKIQNLFPFRKDHPAVNILILSYCDDEIIDSIVKTGIIDCLICPSESDEAMAISDTKNGPLVISIGRLGKYVGKLEIKATEAGKNFILDFSALAVKEDLPREQALIDVYKDYQQLVKQADLLTTYPRFALPDGAKYVGSEACGLCHSYAHEKWSLKPHAHAYATLEKVGSQYDPECVACHVVGLNYDSGFVSEQKTPHLKDVGCENCHGPGYEHTKTLGKIRLTEPKSNCTDCHTPERSGNYAGNENLYFEKIIHWLEPNNADNVK